MVTQKTGKEPSEEHEPMPGCSETYLEKSATHLLTGFAAFRCFSIAGGRTLALVNEPEMKGERQAPAAGDIRFEHVSFAYQDKKALQDVSIVFPRNTLTALFGASGVETVLYE